MFTYGINPDIAVDDSTRDDRGPDTVNRVLLHGARFHDRDAAFLSWEQRRKGWGWDGTPDWRADREACRVALVLAQRLELQPGEAVGMWLPLDRRWATIERGVWTIGCISVPLTADWDVSTVGAVLHDSAPTVLFAPDQEAVYALRATGGLPDSVRAVVLLESVEQDEDSISLDTFLKYGGVLDTAERAAMWRTTARSIAPASPIAWEYTQTPTGTQRTVVNHADLMRMLESLQSRVPPRSGATRLLTDGRPSLISRALLYAAWADGVSQTAFATTPLTLEKARQLAPRLVACRSSDVAIAAELLGPDGATDGSGMGERSLVLTDDGSVDTLPSLPGSGAGIRVLDGNDLKALSDAVSQ